MVIWIGKVETMLVEILNPEEAMVVVVIIPVEILNPEEVMEVVDIILVEILNPVEVMEVEVMLVEVAVRVAIAAIMEVEIRVEVWIGKETPTTIIMVFMAAEVIKTTNQITTLVLPVYPIGL